MQRLMAKQPKGVNYIKLYKYQALNRNSLSALLAKAHWAAKPGSFNDPFDTDPELTDLTAVQKERLREIGIVSLSANPTSSLMWAHYADNHKGFALGFQVWAKDIPENLLEIEYVSKIPDNASSDAIIKAAMYKSSEWAYEDEYRLIYENGNQLIKYPMKLTDVVFGLRMSEADRHLVARVAGKGVGYHWAMRTENEFEVKIDFSKFENDGVHTWPPEP